MLRQEKKRLAVLFAHKHRWCQNAEARDKRGQAVRYDDASAVAWDITGGMCQLFGWKRACELFGTVCRALVRYPRCHPSVDPEIAAMICLQDFNDAPTTDAALIEKGLLKLPGSSAGTPPQGRSRRPGKDRRSGVLEFARAPDHEASSR